MRSQKINEISKIDQYGDIYLLKFGVVLFGVSILSFLLNLSPSLLVEANHIVLEVESSAAHTFKHRTIESLLKEFLDSCRSGSPLCYFVFLTSLPLQSSEFL